jgi:hypothetical protein
MMFTRRALAAFAGLTTGAAGLAASAQTPAAAPVRGDGTRCYIELDGARIDPDIVSLRTAGDTVVGIGAATFSTRLTRSPFARRFTAADGRVFEMQAELDGWSLAAFGMLPNTAADRAQSARNREAHQRAVDHAIWLSMAGQGSQRLVFTPGQYHVDGVIKVFRHDPKDGSFWFVSLEIAAPARGYATAEKTLIRNTNPNQPCYAVQSARNVKFSGFSILGHPDNWIVPSYAQLVGDPAAWSNPARMRDTRWSPACAIVVDPFGSKIVDQDAYPGLEGYYTYNERGSSATVLENMECQGFPVGVLLSPSADTQNNDSVMIRDCDLSYNTVAVAVCQSQNRAVRIENCRIGVCHVMIDTVTYGVGNGAFPLARDLNVTHCKYLINAASGVSRGKLINCDVESTWSIGEWSGGRMPFDLEGCQIKLLPPHILHAPAGKQQPNIDFHLATGAPVNVVGGYVGFYSEAPVPLSILGGGKVRFVGATIDAPVVAESCDAVYYDGANLRCLDAGSLHGAQETFVAVTEGALAVEVHAMMPRGGRAICGSGESTTIYRTHTGVSVLVLDRAPITVKGDGSAFFPTKTPGKYMQGEWLSTTSAWVASRPSGATPQVRNIVIGQVASVEPGRITLQCVPGSFKSGLHDIAVQSLRPFRRRCLASGAAGETVLRSAVPSDHGFKAGDRLLASTVIAEGSYVTAVDRRAGTISISQPALASGLTRVRTADLYLEEASAVATPTSGVTYAGDFIRNRAPIRDERGRIVTGWLALTDGNPGVMAPQYAGPPAAG